MERRVIPQCLSWATGKKELPQTDNKEEKEQIRRREEQI